MERKLTAILAADVVGYSRLMELDEAGHPKDIDFTKSSSLAATGKPMAAP
ncbi:MAG: hypothetical protein IH878_07935 [Gemmatimonadetes bacterium]|nr:hypothetical protein [Gemmatimonadota bacterium]MCH9053790.1 hypothetical protein [Pseudomonadota bacterium]